MTRAEIFAEICIKYDYEIRSGELRFGNALLDRILVVLEDCKILRRVGFTKPINQRDERHILWTLADGSKEVRRRHRAATRDQIASAREGVLSATSECEFASSTYLLKKRASTPYAVRLAIDALVAEGRLIEARVAYPTKTIKVYRLAKQEEKGKRND